MRLPRYLLTGLLLWSGCASAQWLNYPAPGIPRLPDGKPNLSAPAPRTAGGKPDLTGVWNGPGAGSYDRNITRDLKPSDIQPWAEAVYQQRVREMGKDAPRANCLPDPFVYYHMVDIARMVETPQLIVVLYQGTTNSVHRTIFTDGRKLPADPNPTWMGYSIGRWDGDTLVVDTAGFNDRGWLDIEGHPHTDALHITERYHRRDFGHLDLEMTIDDPKTFTRPFSLKIVKELMPDTDLLESVCENDTSVPHMLGGNPVQAVSRGSREVCGRVRILAWPRGNHWGRGRSALFAGGLESAEAAVGGEFRDRVHLAHGGQLGRVHSRCGGRGDGIRLSHGTGGAPGGAQTLSRHSRCARILGMKRLRRTLLLALLPVCTRLHAQRAPIITLVANAEGENPVIAPNTWIEIKGTNLAKATYTRQNSDIVNGQLPTALQGVSVTVNGENAYVYYISSIQIDILTPPDALPATAAVVVNNNGSLSNAFNVAAQALSPSFFVLNGGPYVIAQDAINFNLLGPSSFSAPGYPFTPAKPKEIVTLWANGFGPTNAPIVGGSQTQSGTLATLPVATIGGLTAKVSYAGLAYPGEFQINVTIPANAPSGDDAIVVTYGGVEAAPIGFITVEGSAALPAAVTYYVAPNGNDLWSGTLAAPNSQGTDGPFATFDQARSFVQSIDKAGLTQINVQFRGGTYSLPATEMSPRPIPARPLCKSCIKTIPARRRSSAAACASPTGPTPAAIPGRRLCPHRHNFSRICFTTDPGGCGHGSDRTSVGSNPGPTVGAFFRIAGTVYLPNSATNCTVLVQGSGYECFDRFYYSPTDPISRRMEKSCAHGEQPLQSDGRQPGDRRRHRGPGFRAVQHFQTAHQLHRYHQSHRLPDRPYGDQPSHAVAGRFYRRQPVLGR